MSTIHDVAKEAGVSISTVSYALSGKRPIGADTRRRVEQAVERLSYRAHAGARMLAGETTGLIALSSPMRASTYAPAHMAFTLAVTSAARLRDYDVVLLVQDDATRGLRRMVSSRLVDGIIALDVNTDDERADLIRELGVAAAFIGLPGNTAGLTCVDLDFEAAARLALKQLAAVGHRHIGFIGHPRSAYTGGSNFPPRFRGALRSRAHDLGLAFTEVLPEASDSGEHIVRGLLAQDPGLSAIIFHCDDPTKVEVVEALNARGIRIPEDISVINACTTELPGVIAPVLDVIPLPAPVTAGRGVELLLEQLDSGLQPRVELISPQYVARGTVAACNVTGESR